MQSLNKECPSLLKEIRLEKINLNSLIFGGHDIMNLTMDDVVISHLQDFEVTRINEKHLEKKEEAQGW
jgi:hypothetical protein